MSYPNQNVPPQPSTAPQPKQKPPPQPPDVASTAAAGNDGEKAESNEPPSGSRNPFKPFFTLIEDANSSDHHNPTVHYIFSDDDTDLVTEAALRALEPEGAAPLPPGSYDDDDGQGDRSPRRDPKPSSLPPQAPGVQEHYIVLDMQTTTTPTSVPARSPPEPPTQGAPDTETSTPQTYTVTAAHSLTPTWQVLNTDLSPAPTFDSAPNPESGASPSPRDPSQGGLMLKIKGTAGFKKGPTRGRNNNQDQDQNLEEMMDQFEKRMDELRKVIEAGDIGTGVVGEGDKGVEGEGEDEEEDDREEEEDEDEDEDKAVETEDVEGTG